MLLGDIFGTKTEASAEACTMESEYPMYTIPLQTLLTLKVFKSHEDRSKLSAFDGLVLSSPPLANMFVRSVTPAALRTLWAAWFYSCPALNFREGHHGKPDRI